MQIVLIVVIALHALSGVFWAGSTFVRARSAAAQSELLRPRMGAAIVAVVTGALLWHLLHPGVFGSGERVLAVGALCALGAAGVQAITGLRFRNSIAMGQRVGAGLLAITIACMVVARYV